jgi:hypothetical protein
MFFILYSGILVLKGVLSDEKYDNFLLIHISMKILLSPHSTVSKFSVLVVALTTLLFFWRTFMRATTLVYNVHNLLHISDDCINYQGSLDSFSCFPFEKLLRSN